MPITTYNHQNKTFTNTTSSSTISTMLSSANKPTPNNTYQTIHYSVAKWFQLVHSTAIILNILLIAAGGSE